MTRAWRAILDAISLAAGIGGIVAAPVFLVRDRQPRAFLREHWWAVLAPIVAYGLAVLWAWWREREHRSPGRTAWVAARAFVVTLGLSALAVLLAAVPWPADVLLAAAGTGLLLATTIAAFRQPLRLVFGALSAAALVVLAFHMSTRGRTPPSVEVRTLHTRYGSIVVRTYREYLRQGPTTGGGFAMAANRLFLMTGDGELAEVAFDGSDAMTVRRLPFAAPINGDFSRLAAQRGAVNTFRAAGLMVVERGPELRFYAMHHFWNEAERCFTMRISTIARDGGALDQPAKAAWRTLYETRPCLALPARSGGLRFSIFESGGRLLAFDESHLLVTVGDHEFDGVNSTPAQAQNPDSDYGKTLLIDTETGERQIFTSGHRNQQGLYRDREGVIWSAEHGPDGGDEINRLERGANYGWPIVTYGTDYGEKIWPPNPRPGEHDAFAPPLFTWVPAIGLSSVIRVRGTQFTGWEDDFVAATLRDASLHRLRLRDGHVVFDERIPIGHRIRDVFQMDADRLVLWTDDRALILIRPLTVGQRETEAFNACAGCHPVADGRTHAIGPDLFGVYRRRAATVPGFDFSPALKATSFRWNQEQLDRFIENPAAAVPGTSMDFEGIAEPAEREQIINYLLQAR